MALRLLVWVLTFPENHKKIWTSFRALVTGIPPIVLVIWKWLFDSKVAASAATASKTPLPQFQDGHEVIFVVLLVAPIAFSFSFDIFGYLAAAVKEGRSLGLVELNAILTALDEIVGKKLRRAGEYCAASHGRPIEPHDAFEALMRPDLQIEAIVAQLHVSLRGVVQQNFKIVLARIENERPVAFVQHMPSDSRPPGSLLGEHAAKTFFYSVAKAQEPLIISDIAGHLGRKNNTIQYVKSSNDTDNRGSIVGFPIAHQHLENVAYVLTIKSDTPGMINKAFKDKYERFIEKFLKRIELEHNFEIIRMQCRPR